MIFVYLFLSFWTFYFVQSPRYLWMFVIILVFTINIYFFIISKEYLVLRDWNLLKQMFYRINLVLNTLLRSELDYLRWFIDYWHVLCTSTHPIKSSKIVLIVVDILEKEKRRQLQNPSSRVDSKKKRRLNFLDNVSKKSSAADNSKQRENLSQDDLDLIDEDILNQYKTSSEENKENTKCVHETVEVYHTG